VGENSGYVRVYQYSVNTWTQIGTDIEGEAALDQSGHSISLSDNGNILAIGAPANDGNGANSGHVRVYDDILGTWTLRGSEIDGEVAGDTFGRSVSLSSDGSILAVGAYLNDDNGTNSGHVRIYNIATLSITTNSFGPQFKAYPNPSNGSTNIELGSSFQDVNISIFDLLGKEVMHKTYIDTNKLKIDTQQLPAGVYIVKVEVKTNKASLKLVVK
jgi:hypothetical protein